MAQQSSIDVIPLGSQGLKVPRLGFGCMGLSWYDAANLKTEDAVEVIGTAMESGITYFDTGDFYGCGSNEKLVAQALAKYGRDKFVVGVKFGLEFDEEKNEMLWGKGVNGTPEYIKTACENSLKRLGIDQIDVYFLARVDPKTPIETSVAAMAELVKEGKVKYLGLSECSAETLRRAHKVHPITAVQIEYSMWCTEPEQTLFPTCKELGVGILAYSPLGRGFLTGKVTPSDLPKDDYRSTIPRWQGENYNKNAAIVAEVEKIAKAKGCTTGQLALAWVHRNRDLVSIPGTKRISYLKENVAAMAITVTDEEDKQIRELMSQVVGTRYDEHGMKGVGI
eukprot:TRINITY_DN4952_c0_g1_i1.p1 TRINITY_DN4952_c0_g1~~TRINITY_DN4952_c0_g1_i1.p1  ORF type:complete len:348 (-),score=64.12 TRINITY_DN4952_c0_g1_i1:8-1018(-)